MNEFYVGYLPSAPPGIRRRVRLIVALALLLSIAGAALFSASQGRFAESFFDFGKTSDFTGTLRLQPYPALIVDSPLSSNPSGEVPYLLVAPGKHGADTFLANRDSMRVKLRGTLIHREEGKMLEIVPASIVSAESAPQRSSQINELGEASLSGEIVDTKCYLGVMNPGQGKVHRDCAARCLSGGIPPALVTRDFDGNNRLFLLTDASGQALPKEAFLDKVGQPVSIRGQAWESQGLYFLRTNASSIVPLP